MRNQRADRAFAVYVAARAARDAFYEAQNADFVIQAADELREALNQAERRAWAVVQEVWRREELNGVQYEEVVA
jgi:hypothetical protein